MDYIYVEPLKEKVSAGCVTYSFEHTFINSDLRAGSFPVCVNPHVLGTLVSAFDVVMLMRANS